MQFGVDICKTDLEARRILVVDDDKQMLHLLKSLLMENGFIVLTAESLSETSKILAESPLPDLIILDLMLPDGNGIDACQQITQQYHIPIIMLTAVDNDVKKILSYELGACQYITKPFNADVLVAQVKSVVRQLFVTGKNSLRKRYVHFQNWILDIYDRYLINPSDISIELSGSEYEVLTLLLESNRNIVSRNQITTKIFKRKYDGIDRSVDVIIGRLRKKIEKNTAEPKIIKTIHGLGYIMLVDIIYSNDKARPEFCHENKH
ncbi:response regulator [Facilibium subflavum]|uniref:response regulator n=1 Tax=Facilibium subflavum TaxID=2219058 RepID=UPI000E650657|nr:response regulator transcription factor [Facilibium subflavum]